MLLPVACSILPGYGPTAGAAICKHPGVDKLAFTVSRTATTAFPQADALPAVALTSFISLCQPVSGCPT
jgi:acyl-CoA reductase-like NAD-dependent aldehyde dehydrogenase